MNGVITKMLILTQLPCCWSAVLVVVGSLEFAHYEKTIRASTTIRAGMNESTVQSILGAPLERWDARSPGANFFFGPRPRQWIYGTVVDLKRIIVPKFPYLNPIPINLRLFTTEDDDLVIDWSDANVVQAVHRP
jgi:hypothetical protein